MMAANIYTEQGKNIRKTWFLMTVFFVMIILIGYVFATIYQNTAILVGAIAFSTVLNIASYWYSDNIVLSMHGARPATRAGGIQTTHHGLRVQGDGDMGRCFLQPAKDPVADHET